MNLPQQLQEYLNYPKLQQIDPTTDLPKDPLVFDPVKQSVLITFLVALYKATRKKENAAVISTLSSTPQILDTIFPEEESTLQTIANYTKQSPVIIREYMMEVAGSYVKFFQQTAETHTKKDVYLQDIMTSQRNLILSYIPSGLKLGDLLHDETLEDTTNKMQGPISSLMHIIEGNMSKSD